MLLLSLLLAIAILDILAVPSFEPCCLEKMVGGVDYVLQDENTGMTSGLGCLQDCIYVRLVLNPSINNFIDCLSYVD